MSFRVDEMYGLREVGGTHILQDKLIWRIWLYSMELRPRPGARPRGLDTAVPLDLRLILDDDAGDDDVSRAELPESGSAMRAESEISYLDYICLDVREIHWPNSTGGRPSDRIDQAWVEIDHDPPRPETLATFSTECGLLIRAYEIVGARRWRPRGAAPCAWPEYIPIEDSR